MAIFPVVMFSFAAVFAVMILISYVQLNGIYARTVSLQNELTQLRTEGDSLRAEYEEVFNQDVLERAVKKAGNLTPSNGDQIVYVELSDPDNVVVYDQEERTSMDDFLDSVRTFFSGDGS